MIRAARCFLSISAISFIISALKRAAQPLVVSLSGLWHDLRIEFGQLLLLHRADGTSEFGSHGRFTVHGLRRVFSMALMLLMVSQQTFAAPAVSEAVAGTAKAGILNSAQDLRFWWHSSGWEASALAHWPFKQSASASTKGWDGKGAPPRPRPTPESPEKKQDREAKVARVRISPGDVTIRTGEQVVFAAIAYDKDGHTISGLDCGWNSWDEDKPSAVTISAQATFASATPGHHKVTATVAGHQAQVKVTVVGEERHPNVTSESSTPVSSRDHKEEPKKTSSLAPAVERTQVASTPATTRANRAGSKRQPLRASASSMALRSPVQISGEDTTGWNTTNYMTADDPGKECGNMPGHAPDGGAGSGDMQFAAPLLGLDGRGIDLNFGLAYNSRLWHKSGSDMYFDIDRDWIPGWTLGFGKIVMAGNGFMLIDGSGTRHSYNGNFHNTFLAPYTSLQSYEGYTNDGTFIDYYAEGYKPQFDNSGGKNIQYAWAKLPNGTQIDYGAAANYAIYPTRITDANGNYITITYRSNQGPNIDTITDTLGRVIHFYYELQGDGTELLTAITAPGMRDAQGNWTDRTIAQFQYSAIPLNNAGTNYGFVGGLVTHVRKNTIPTVKAIYYPATGTGYWFGDIDSYSPYGMIRKISERRGMTITGGSLTQQGTISAGSMSREMVYSHLSSPGYSFPHIYGSLSDTPTFTQSTEDWAARDTPSAPLTSYAVVDNSSTLIRTTTITRPDGVQIQQDTDNNPSSPNYGLLLEDRTYADSTHLTMLHKSKVFWEHGAYNSPRPTRTEVTDDRGSSQLTATNFTYGAFYNSVVDVRDYDYGGTALLRRTHTDYNNTTAYNGSLINAATLWWHAPGTFYGGPQWSGPHIFNLASAVEVYASDDTTRASRTEYQYDQTPAAQLVDTPGVTQHTTASDYRGNLTSGKRYADAVGLTGSTAVTETRGYDICGNVRTLSTSCCEQTSFTYTANTFFAWPETVVRGSATDTTKQITTSAVYDLNTGLVKGAYDANGRYSNTSYQTTTLRPEFEYASTGAYTYHIYDDANMIVYDIAYEANQSGGNFVSRSDKYIDGYGRVHGENAYGIGYVVDSVVTKFDNLGRLWQQTRPYRNGSESQQWFTYAYDTMDRLTTVTAPDGSAAQRFYNESSYPSAATPGALGQTVRAKDAWNRERWARFDAQNRMVEVVEPYTGTGADGTVASNGWFTKYTYNTLGNLTLVEQSPQYNQPVEQKRSFKYDALSRLTNQKLAERDATLDDAGNAGSTWSDFFSYDTRSNLIQRIDARRVKTIFTYNNDPLNRLQSVSYDKAGAINPSTIIDAASVTYSYLTSGDLTQLYSVTMSDNVGNETYGYDVERRLNQRTQSFANIVPLLNTSYSWDTLSRLSQMTYPTQHGASGLNKTAAYSFDLASRLSGATYASATIATVSDYNAASQALSLSLGNTLTESYSYDAQTGLFNSQSVNQGATKLVDLAYGYNDANGKKTGQLLTLTDSKNSHRSRAFSYDKLGRVSQVSGTSSGGAWQQAYSYDRYGNRLSVARTGVGASVVPLDAIDTGNQNSNTLTYASGANQPVSNRITTTGYTYDAAGNLTKGEAPDGSWQRYQYDSAGRLSKVINDANSQELASYSYGVSNQRLIASDNGGAVVTYYAWDGGQVIAEYTKSGISLVFQKSHVYLGGRLLVTEKADQSKQYHHPDRLGTRMVTDGSGTPISENVVLPFGTMLAAGTTLYGDNSYQSTTQSNPSKRFFTSYDRSQTTKLDYAVNRHYNAGQGRFTQVDPIGMGAVDFGDPQTLNLYAYCGNDPVNRTDPDGLFFGWLKKLAGAVAKVLQVVFKVVAVLAAIAVILAVAWSVPAILGLALWKVALIAGAALVAAFASGKLAQIFGGVAGAVARGPGNFRTPSTFPGGVSSFLQQGADTATIWKPWIVDRFEDLLARIRTGGKPLGEPGEPVQCAQLPQRWNASVGSVSYPAGRRGWMRGPNVMGSAIQPGTVVATFLGQDFYPNNLRGNHVGIYVTGDADGFWIAEQYQSGNTGVLQFRYIKASPVKKGKYGDYLTNANQYSIVYVPTQAPPNCNCGDSCAIK